jgi:predicted transposase/invertase (TIGR01784 family)
MQDKKTERVSLTKDLPFRKVMSSAEHPEVVRGFINDILGLDVDEVEIENPYDIRSFVDEQGKPVLRETQVDVLVRLKDGSKVSVEMQVAYQSHYLSRAAYLACSRMIADYGNRRLQRTTNNTGDAKYSSLNPIYGINIMVEDVFVDEHAVHLYELYDRKHGLLFGENSRQAGSPNPVTITFWELGKNLESSSADMLQWLKLFNGEELDKDAPGYIKQAAHMIAYDNLTREEQEVIDWADIREQDRKQREADIRRESLAEGVELGSLTKAMETARNLIKEGVSPDIISRSTGVTEQQLASPQEPATA